MDKFTNCFFFLKKEPDQGWPIWKYGLYLFYRAAILLCAGLCMGLAVLVLAIGPFTKEIAVSYLQYWELVVLNIVPVMLPLASAWETTISFSSGTTPSILRIC